MRPWKVRATANCGSNDAVVRAHIRWLLYEYGKSPRVPPIFIPRSILVIRSRVNGYSAFRPHGHLLAVPSNTNAQNLVSFPPATVVQFKIGGGSSYGDSQRTSVPDHWTTSDDVEIGYRSRPSGVTASVGVVAPRNPVQGDGVVDGATSASSGREQY